LIVRHSRAGADRDEEVVMLLLKHSLGLKLAIGVLGLVVGVGGVTAGAKYNEAHPAGDAQVKRIFVGTIVAVGPHGFELHTRLGRNVKIEVFPNTSITRLGHPFARADLRVGDVVLVQCKGKRNEIFFAIHVTLLRATRPSAQGP
jgi:hypothetical protein